MENNKKIYRNSPNGYNTHIDYLDRREKVYNPHSYRNFCRSFIGAAGVDD